MPCINWIKTLVIKIHIYKLSPIREHHLTLVHVPEQCGSVSAIAGCINYLDWLRVHNGCRVRRSGRSVAPGCRRHPQWWRVGERSLGWFSPRSLSSVWTKSSTTQGHSIQYIPGKETVITQTKQ